MMRAEGQESLYHFCFHNHVTCPELFTCASPPLVWTQKCVLAETKSSMTHPLCSGSAAPLRGVGVCTCISSPGAPLALLDPTSHNVTSTLLRLAPSILYADCPRFYTSCPRFPMAHVHDCLCLTRFSFSSAPTDRLPSSRLPFSMGVDALASLVLSRWGPSLTDLTHGPSLRPAPCPRSALYSPTDKCRLSGAQRLEGR